MNGSLGFTNETHLKEGVEQMGKKDLSEEDIWQKNTLLVKVESHKI